MKKYILLVISIFMFTMFMPFIVDAKESIEIKSIELDSKSENTIVKSEPTYSGLEMNYDLSFKTTGDYVKYKVIIKNTSDTDYKISEDTSFNESEYITYKYEFDPELKAKEEATVYVNIIYSKEVDGARIINNKYTESNKAIIQLLNVEGQVINDPNTIKNPNTGNKLVTLIIILLLFLSIIVLLVITNKKRIKYISIVLAIGLCTIPILVYATETIKLAINVSVEIGERFSVNYITWETIKTVEKSNYQIIDFSEFGIDKPSCRTILNDPYGSLATSTVVEGYEVCAMINKTEKHSPGERVKIFNKMTYHTLDEDGNLMENTVVMDYSRHTEIWDYLFYDRNSEPNATIHYYDQIFYSWAYKKALNNYDDLDELDFKGNIINKWDSQYEQRIDIYASNQSFTMPSHDIFFYPLGSEGEICWHLDTC